MIIKSEVVYITPHIASEMLAKNYDKNRKLSISWVSELARSMKSGEFKSMNGQNRIIIGTDGTLYDGQHRLKAIICSGVTLPFEICTSDSAEDDYKTFDYAKVKQSKHFVDGKLKNERAAIAKIAYSLKFGVMPISTCINNSTICPIRVNGKSLELTPSRVEIVEYHDKNSDYFLDLASKATQMRRRIGSGSAAVYGAVLFFLSYIGIDKHNIEQFVDEMLCEFPQSRAIRYAQDSVRKAYAMKGITPSKMFLFTKLMAAYAGFMSGDKIINKNFSLDSLLKSYDNALKAARERDTDRDENK